MAGAGDSSGSESFWTAACTWLVKLDGSDELDEPEPNKGTLREILPMLMGTVGVGVQVEGWRLDAGVDTGAEYRVPPPVTPLADGSTFL